MLLRRIDFDHQRPVASLDVAVEAGSAVGLVVIALAAILGRVRDDWKLKKLEREPRPGDY
jgi:hypothetical protein